MTTYNFGSLLNVPDWMWFIVAGYLAILLIISLANLVLMWRKGRK